MQKQSAMQLFNKQTQKAQKQSTPLHLVRTYLYTTCVTSINSCTKSSQHYLPPTHLSHVWQTIYNTHQCQQHVQKLSFLGAFRLILRMTYYHIIVVNTFISIDTIDWQKHLFCLVLLALRHNVIFQLFPPLIFSFVFCFDFSSFSFLFCSLSSLFFCFKSLFYFSISLLVQP